MNDYRIAGIDVHKKMLAVVVAELTTAGELAFQRRQFDNTEAGIHQMRDWFAECQVREAVMESTATAQNWKAVWLELEGQFRLHLAQAMSNRAPRGRKRDFADAEGLVRRLIAGELVLSYVPTGSSGCGACWHARNAWHDAPACSKSTLWKHFWRHMRIKLSSVLSDITGVSGWRILDELAKGAQDRKLVKLADPSVKCTREQIQDA